MPTTILPKSHFDIITVNKPENKKQVTDEGTFDFVDSPLADKQLLSSGSSQASRVNVKKGPNGQDYEYEYVYYYYDEDDEPVGPAKPAGPATARAPLTTTEASRPRRPLTEQDIAPQKVNSRNRWVKYLQLLFPGALTSSTDCYNSLIRVPGDLLLTLKSHLRVMNCFKLILTLNGNSIDLLTESLNWYYLTRTEMIDRVNPLEIEPCETRELYN